MPQVLVNLGTRTIARSMPTPKRVSEIEAWYKGARKVVLEIPDVGREPGWYFKTTLASLEYVKFRLQNRDTGETCSIHIDRFLGNLR